MMGRGNGGVREERGVRELGKRSGMGETANGRMGVKKGEELRE